jgi:hypothetical protein
MLHGIAETKKKGHIRPVFLKPPVKPLCIDFTAPVVHTKHLSVIRKKAIAATVFTGNAQIHYIDGSGFHVHSPSSKFAFSLYRKIRRSAMQSADFMVLPIMDTVETVT